MTQEQQTVHLNEETELAAKTTASDRANAAKWGLNTVVTLFGILIVVILLLARGTDTDVVGGLAILGLIAVWFFSWRRGKQLSARFYVEEVANLQASPLGIAAVQGLLTTREVQVLNFASEGLSNKQIGKELGISESTVKHFISSSMTKLDAYDRTHAVVTAIKRGIIFI